MYTWQRVGSLPGITSIVTHIVPLLTRNRIGTNDHIVRIVRVDCNLFLSLNRVAGRIIMNTHIYDFIAILTYSIANLLADECFRYLGITQYFEKMQL